MTTMDFAQEYFLCHLERKKWLRINLSDRQAAVALAEEEIMRELGLTSMDTDDRLLMCAVAEQALFLADSYERAHTAEERSAGQLKSETIEGLGSRSYYPKAETAADSGTFALPRLAPRAEFFLSKYPGFRTNRIQRG